MMTIEEIKADLQQHKKKCEKETAVIVTCYLLDRLGEFPHGWCRKVRAVKKQLRREFKTWLAKCNRLGVADQVVTGQVYVAP